MEKIRLPEGDFSYIERNLFALHEEIACACARAGRADEITLVAVTKSATDEELCALCALGVSDIGENRPQELARRGALLKTRGFTPRLHEIGNLQKNKVRLIAGEVALIHSLDSLVLAAEIERQAKKCGRIIPVLVEVNSGREEQKGGLLPEETIDFCERLQLFPHLALRGLMTMGPVLERAEDYRPYFRLTRELFDRAVNLYAIERPILSMGMSDSFTIAVEEGATVVRVGRRLFFK